MSAPMVAQAVACRRGEWSWDGATLRTRGTMRHGVLRAAAGVFEVDPTDRRRRGVVARTGGRPVVTLHPDGASVPGPGGPARWSPGRHSGTLTRDGNRIHVQGGRPGAPLRVEVSGAWPDLDLLVLTACFAVLTSRRRRLIMAVMIAGAGGAHGQ